MIIYSVLIAFMLLITIISLALHFRENRKRKIIFNRTSSR
ncbi:hypothetical protein EZJ58_3929 [Sodalis ligni]|jgi:hypothetical protein|uniref:Uncharacterized protein n=1 Tax=Sodalis ligni TaxID=2697027 RepID=A0A4R1NDR3_9GAMM|nr:hypothetical protein EZJ58_3929 [Sodalis ligni]